MECYNPQTNQWTKCASMETTRYNHQMVVVDGTMYAVGGLENDLDCENGEER